MKAESLIRVMRALHRDIGFFLIGLTLIYCISGVLLTFRDGDFLKSEVMVEKLLDADLKASQLSGILHKKVNVVEEDSYVIKFSAKGSDGVYEKETGKISYKSMEYPAVIDAFNKLHKSSEKDVRHYFTVVYGCLLAFMALSSFFMYKSKSRMLKRGLIISFSGLICTAVLLAL